VSRFLDTDILVYANSRDRRRAMAQACLAPDAVVSVQVLNEFANVLRRKLGKTWDEITDAVEDVLSLVKPPLQLTLETHRKALALARDHGVNIYDALIVSAALEGGCREVLTEAMDHGRNIEGLTIRNPFRVTRR
jgi:predicted nucleic acid-binding protein